MMMTDPATEGRFEATMSASPAMRSVSALPASTPATATARRRRVPPAAGLLLLLPFLLVPACAQKAKKQGGPAMGAVPVTVSDAVRKDVPVALKAIGAVDAYRTVRVNARVGGELAQIAFQEGQNVRQGDLLFKIDPRPYEAALAAATADSARDGARAVSANAQEKRYAELVEKDYVTRDQYEEVKANAAAMRATVDADAANCRSARLSLSFCSIRAPISGRTGSLLVHPGNMVSAGGGDPLVVIQQIVPAVIRFSVPEQRLAEIRKYQATGDLRVEATLSGDSTDVIPGELTFFDNEVDQTTGTVMLKATFPNTDERLWPGQFMNVNVILTVRPNAIVIPSQALQKSQRGDFVYVVKPDLTATMQPVVVDMRVGDDIVIESGLAEGDRVVTDGQLRLTPNGRVEIKGGVAGGGAGGGPGAPGGAGGAVGAAPGGAPGGTIPK